jgi:hypothetical protein
MHGLSHCTAETLFRLVKCGKCCACRLHQPGAAARPLVHSGLKHKRTAVLVLCDSSHPAASPRALPALSRPCFLALLISQPCRTHPAVCTDEHRVVVGFERTSVAPVPGTFVSGHLWPGGSCEQGFVDRRVCIQTSCRALRLDIWLACRVCEGRAVELTALTLCAEQRPLISAEFLKSSG